MKNKQKPNTPKSEVLKTIETPMVEQHIFDNLNSEHSKFKEEISIISSELETVKKEREAFQNIANTAASKLVSIESAVTPFLNRKFNVVTAIYHLKDVVELIKQIVEAVKEFRAQFMAPNIKPDDSTK